MAASLDAQQLPFGPRHSWCSRPFTREEASAKQSVKSAETRVQVEPKEATGGKSAVEAAGDEDAEEAASDGVGK